MSTEETTTAPAAPFSTAAVALRALLAGNARITVRSVKTAARYTFRISKAKAKAGEEKKAPLYFVSLLTGPDNGEDYQYIGTLRQIRGEWTFSTTAKSKLPADSAPCKAIAWMVGALDVRGAIPSTLEVWHEGRCCRCGRDLTVPESIASGLGPECAKRAA